MLAALLAPARGPNWDRALDKVKINNFCQAPGALSYEAAQVN